ncbi:PREDICTED: GLIPR1-like protein 2, partial [Apaloderma vittatum]|uniref:GLIPR1-like protein 2 n=1 Tax=Apaloderma vittatum TaxID=57397 RepID=UPI00052140FC
PPASNMRYVTWDAALARTAKAWANKCIFKRNIHLDKKHQCHQNFTSVVLDYSYKIGCAVTFCKKVAGIPNAANFICNYSQG